MVLAEVGSLRMWLPSPALQGQGMAGCLLHDSCNDFQLPLRLLNCFGVSGADSIITFIMRLGRTIALVLTA